jgi:hypothetical protein
VKFRVYQAFGGFGCDLGILHALRTVAGTWRDSRCLLKVTNGKIDGCGDGEGIEPGGEECED